MKRFLLTILAISTMVFSQAQEEGVIYTDFNPDLCISTDNYPNCFYDTIKIDFDQNGAIDFKVFLSWRSTGEIAIDMLSSWEHRFRLSGDDSIVPKDGSWLILNYPWQYMIDDDTTHMENEIGFRMAIDGATYYAWAKVSADIQYTSSHNNVWAHVDDIAFCTVPDYPLRWGQTSLTCVEENETAAFAVVHPNPTQGTVTVTGQNLRKADIVDILGQHVATVVGKGKTLQIDISKLPAGIYFVRITDDEGRKCTHKVVKE